MSLPAHAVFGGLGQRAVELLLHTAANAVVC